MVALWRQNRSNWINIRRNDRRIAGPRTQRGAYSLSDGRVDWLRKRHLSDTSQRGDNRLCV